MPGLSAIFKQIIGNNISLFVHIWEALLENNVSWFVHAETIWLRNIPLYTLGKKHGWQTASHCLPPSGNMAAAGAKLGNDVSLFFHF